jgi:uncharacterized protein (TIGR02271 family)
MGETHARVFGDRGLEGKLLDSFSKGSSRPVRIALDDGRVIEVSPSALRGHSPGTYWLEADQDVQFTEAPPVVTAEDAVVPVLAEEMRVGKQVVTTGVVRVHRRVIEDEEEIDVPLLKEHVDVRHVIHDREVDGPMPVRKEGDTTVIPIVEEVLVISKKYVLKEEVHVTRVTREEVHHERVTTKRQEPFIERLDGDSL